MSDEQTYPLYPKIVVPMIGKDGNALAILGRAQQLAKKAGLTQAQIDEYMTEAMSGDYDHLLQTTLRYFNVK